MRKIIGVDIGGTKCAVLLAHVGSGIDIVDKITFPTHTERGFEYTKEALFSQITKIMDKHGLTAADVTAIGVSCGGPLDGKKALILSPPNLPGWVNIPFAQMLEDSFHIPAYLQNDANACALVEWKLGAGRGFDHVIFLTMGTGMGAGIISEGVLLEGASGMGGEVGHLRLADDGPWGFEKNGSFEGFCSGGGIARWTKQLTEKWMEEGRTPAWVRDGLHDISAGQLGEYAERGDADAQEILRLVGEKLGEGVSLLIDILNPERIVIGSIFTRREKYLRRAMEQVINRETIGYSRKVVQVVPAQTGERIGDYASIMAACYAIGLEPMPYEENRPDVLAHLHTLLERYPVLTPLKGEIMAAYALICAAYTRDKKLLICGNGGSAADAGHITGELMKGFFKKRPFEGAELAALTSQFAEAAPDAPKKLQRALQAIDLTQHGGLSTAFANDVSPELVFAQQVCGYGRRGDVLLCLSTSGNSQNCVYAALAARARGVGVISMTGPQGGKLAELSDMTIKAPGRNTAEVQELHLPVYHCLCAMLEERFFA